MSMPKNPKIKVFFNIEKLLIFENDVKVNSGQFLLILIKYLAIITSLT